MTSVLLKSPLSSPSERGSSIYRSMARRKGLDRFRHGIRVTEVECEQPLRFALRERAVLLGRHGDLHPEAISRLHECAGAVGSGGKDEEQPGRAAD